MAVEVWYLDTSAALKLLLDEPQSVALADHLTHHDPRLVSCWLLETEMRRATFRTPLTQATVSEFLRGVDLYAVPGSIYGDAGRIDGTNLGSFDALHLAVALRQRVDAIVTYDERLAAAAETSGLRVVAPR